MYFQGVKMYLLEHEIVRKLYRHRYQDFADFIVMLMFRRELINDFITLDENTNKLTLQKQKIDKLGLKIGDITSNL